MSHNADGQAIDAGGRVPLVAGPLSMQLDAATGFLRYISCGEQEVLRGIYVAIRDRNWGTIEPEISDLQITAGDREFRVSFQADCRRGAIDFTWRGTITGSRAGEILYEMAGEARSSFLRNRIGFCVLHGSGTCAGLDCVVEHIDGSQTQGAFPRDVSPHQPLKNMQAIRHQAAPGLAVRVAFKGDVFEMEDQRNWTDASFKTYCTPLDRPFPVQIEAGDQVRQTVAIVLEETEEKKMSGTLSVASPKKVPDTFSIPRIGLGAASHDQSLSGRAVQRLRQLRLDHLRADVNLADVKLGQSNLDRSLLRAARESEQIGVRLHIAMESSDWPEEPLHTLAQYVEQHNISVAAWLLLAADAGPVSEAQLGVAKRALQSCAPQASLVVGTNGNFAELNRRRPSPGVADGVCYSVNPQAHAFDDASLVETLEGQPDTVQTARTFAGDADIFVSPITLKPRGNPAATGPEAPPGPDQLPAQVDPRQPTLLAAGWTLGSVIALAIAKADSATYYETTGWLGLMETEAGSPLPRLFPTRPGCVFPVYHVLCDLADVAGAELRPVCLDRSLTVCGLAAHREEGTTFLLANLTPQDQWIVLPIDVQPGISTTVRMLDQQTLERAMYSSEEFRASEGFLLRNVRLELPPYALARVEHCRAATETEGQR